MSWFGALVVFTVAWWMIFFITLPFGVSAPENSEPGNDTGAPDKSHLAVKALVTTLFAGALTGGLHAAVEYQVIDFRALLF